MAARSSIESATHAIKRDWGGVPDHESRPTFRMHRPFDTCFRGRVRPSLSSPPTTHQQRLERRAAASFAGGGATRGGPLVGGGCGRRARVWTRLDIKIDRGSSTMATRHASARYGWPRMDRGWRPERVHGAMGAGGDSPPRRDVVARRCFLRGTLLVAAITYCLSPATHALMGRGSKPSWVGVNPSISSNHTHLNPAGSRVSRPATACRPPPPRRRRCPRRRC